MSDPAQKTLRRELVHLGVGLLSGLALLPLALRPARAAPSCGGAASESMRASLHYTDAAANAKQSCSACSFFTAPERGQSCGSCAIMNDQVNPKGHCESFAPKG